MPQSCKLCRHLEVEPDAAGRRVVRKDYLYRCVAPIPDLSAIMPASVMPRLRGIVPHSMTGDRGQTCPTFLPWKER